MDGPPETAAQLLNGLRSERRYSKQAAPPAVEVAGKIFCFVVQVGPVSTKFYCGMVDDVLLFDIIYFLCPPVLCGVSRY